jgi:hypothetical protein
LRKLWLGLLTVFPAVLAAAGSAVSAFSILVGVAPQAVVSTAVRSIILVNSSLYNKRSISVYALRLAFFSPSRQNHLQRFVKHDDFARLPLIRGVVKGASAAT